VIDTPAILDHPAPRPAQDALWGMLPLDLRVLVVDDNRDAADSLATLLDTCGADVRTCYDGQAALTVATGFDPAAALLDVDMPGMDGCELARKLRLRATAAGRQLLLVAITGVDDPGARARADAAGFDLFLTKPADPVALIRTLVQYRCWHRDSGGH
jgi:CheY-like chemotaxis protein